MHEKYQKAWDLGIELMSRYPSDSWHYNKGQKIAAWAADRNRQEQKVVLSAPAGIGSLQEKLEHNAWLDSIN